MGFFCVNICVEIWQGGGDNDMLILPVQLFHTHLNREKCPPSCRV